ncbi:hypothetical protein C8Q77DRAFT_190145 [Trametes polyzona]|nr:hypothetical protein C8Q77DRAFT_190145 [Trametes polyzona]
MAAPRWTKELDDQTFQQRNIVDDADVPQPLPVYLARIWQPATRTLHWAIVWEAFRHTGGGGQESHGWHNVDIRQRTDDDPKLFFRHHHKLPTAGTTQIWTLTQLAGAVSGENRVHIISFGELWEGPEGRGNCITCVCDVIKELVHIGALPQEAAGALDAAWNQDAQDQAKKAILDAASYCQTF